MRIILSKLGIEEIQFNTIKSMYDKLIANTNFNGEKLKMIQLRSGTGQGCVHATLLFNTLGSGSLSQKNQQGKEIKGIQIGEEEGKFISA